ncbi:hypothetical protein [Acinetobacter sp. P1(2025)]|uniref:hypothetical protein n=1 Tax=Acinetobacter sp. P1(2025) TaxID=3446120 RepID=UPI003F538321
MNIYEAIECCSELIPYAQREVNLWRVEQAIDNKKTYFIPTDALNDLYDDFLFPLPFNAELCGINLHNKDFLHSLVLWNLFGKTIRVSDQILNFVWNAEFLERVDSSIFYKLPSQSFFVASRVDNFSGFLATLNFIEDDQGKQFYIIINLLNESGGKGKQINYVIPRAQSFNLFEDIKGHQYEKTLSKVFYLLLYVVDGFQQKTDIIKKNDIFYLGFRFANEYEANKSISGFWRKAHWHTYYTKNDDGEEEAIVNWVAPVWVNK